MVHVIAKAYNRVLPLYAKGALLDLGCGQVPLYGAYAHLVEEISCVDWGGSVHETLHLDAEMDLNAPLPIADASYDTVILSDVLEHIAQPDRLMKEIGRILRPGGHLLMNVPFFYYLHEQPHDHHRYTRHALRRMAEDGNMEVVELEALGGWVESTADLIGKAVHALPFIGPVLSWIWFGLVYLLHHSPVGPILIRKSSGSFPYAYLMVTQRST